jgi:hypothetical protein
MLKLDLNIFFSPPSTFNPASALQQRMRRQDSAMHALRVNTARVQTPLMIKMVSSPDVFPAVYLLLHVSWNSSGDEQLWGALLIGAWAKRARTKCG